MSRSGWKRLEVEVAKKLGGTRHWANSGGLVDVTAPGLLVQVKERRRITLRELERWAREIDGEAMKETLPMFADRRKGILVVKRSAGAGRKTEALVVMTLEAWCR